MMHQFQLARPLALLAGVLIFAGRLGAQSVVSDGFESGSFNAAWGLTNGVILTATGGANGTTRFAKLAAYTASTGRELGARFDSVASGGAKDFSVECFFRSQSTTQRQFNFQVSTSATAISSSGASINLRYDVTNGWAAFSTAWNSIASLGSITPGQWYRLRVTGQDWGTATARWAVDVSAAGGTNYVNSATNLTWFQSGTPTANTAKFFLFTTVFGNSPGFDVDEVSAAVTATNTPPPTVTNAVVNISGVYPHLAVFSADGEIGIGAVMPWAGKIWFVTYPPHAPTGSSDKLWMLDTNLALTAHPSSVGCTDANRLVHRESQQLNIGHYLIDSNANVRVIAPATMPGRLTGSARHLFDATNKIYIASMEEGIYEVNVNTLAVTELYHDMNTAVGAGQTAAALPGQHGKGLYSAQGKLFYSNNGVGGSLSQWNGTNWTVIESNKFTELTGPGGVYGNDASDDRLWSLGWDTRSVILRLLQNGAWTRFRLPKASYTHDADHGWFTEWPRIREIVDGKMLMHMHGMFYYFPKTFSATNTGGLTPISTYLKMPVDYCWWNGQLVMGRDDASTTGGNIWTSQSVSAPWFGQLADLEKWGTPAGFGGVWLNDSVTANVPSEAFLVKNFQRRILHLKHTTAATVNFTLQHDATGNGAWTNLTTLSVTNNGYAYFIFPPNFDTTWVRLAADQNASGVTAYFQMQSAPQPPTPDLFAGLADANATNALSDGIIRSQQGDARTLQFASTVVASNGAASTGYYEINGALRLARATNATAENTLRTTYSLSNANFTLDAASVIYTEGANRFRLPRSSAATLDAAFASGWPRGAREVTTERQLFQAHGTFYELPYSASGGFRRVRPVTTHNKHISDFASWRGLLAFTGVSANAATNNRVYRSDDGQTALWFGDVDDLWRMGAPSGVGGPWKNSAVTNGVASDPYLMFGYERKELALSHSNAAPVTFTVEVDFAADNSWSPYTQITVPAGQTVKHIFPDGYSAHWVRVKSDTTTTATAQFTYGPAAPIIISSAMLPGGNFQLTFTGSAGQPFTVRASDNLNLPSANWTPLTNAIFTTNPATFLDSPATNARRFFQISIP